MQTTDLGGVKLPRVRKTNRRPQWQRVANGVARQRKPQPDPAGVEIVWCENPDPNGHGEFITINGEMPDQSELKKRVWRVLNQYCELKRLSTPQLAGLLEVTPGSLANLKAGTGLFNGRLATTMAGQLGISVYHLVIEESAR